jgi:hypothetical protein
MNQCLMRCCNNENAHVETIDLCDECMPAISNMGEDAVEEEVRLYHSRHPQHCRPQPKEGRLCELCDSSHTTVVKTRCCSNDLCYKVDFHLCEPCRRIAEDFDGPEAGESIKFYHAIMHQKPPGVAAALLMAL